MAANWMPDVCIYHADCTDGFTAAWAVWKRATGEHAVDFIAASYDDPPPDVHRKKVLIVDFSYPDDVLRDMALWASSILVLDHHESAEKEIEGFRRVHRPHWREVGAEFVGTNVLVEFDTERCGARMAWDFCWRMPAPTLVDYVEDRDLWRWAKPSSRAVSAFLGIQDFDFEDWTDLYRQFDNVDGLKRVVELGRPLLQARRKQVYEYLRLSQRAMTIGGFTVPVANMPRALASDAGHILANGARFAATYFDSAGGRRVFSLHSDSDGINVAEIAAAYGGGGHAHSAGFTMPLGWEGDVADGDNGAPRGGIGTNRDHG